MATAADAPWRMIAQQIWSDLQPFEGRLGLTWRVALLCAIVAGVAMMHKIPESAISCYLIIFLMRPNGAECVGQAVGLIILATILVLGMAPLIQVLAEAPLLRVAVIAGATFVFMYLSSASQLGEIGAIIGLVIAFILTMVDLVPAGEIVTRGLLYAWAMACMPMALMIGFSLVFGTGPHTLLRQTIAERLTAAADLLQTGDRRKATALLAEGQTEVDKRVMMTRAFHTATKAEALWLAGAAAASYRMLLAAGAVATKGAVASRGGAADADHSDAPRTEVEAATRQTLAARCHVLAQAVRDRAPMPKTADANNGAAGAAADSAATDPAFAVIRRTLDGLAAPDGGLAAKPAKIPFLAPDAFTNPDHQTYALKTTAAAVMAYLTYSLLDWEGIATAMVTCYVASLGTTGETVHKLCLRIGGCLIGALIGILSILFVIPHLTSVGGLMGLVFCAILPAAWVSTGSERISYGGVQIGLAFLLTVLNGFGPSLDMDSARDRIIGILLGNMYVFIMFTNFWPTGAVVEARRRLSGALAALARIAAMAPEARPDAVNDIAAVASQTATAKMALDMTPFEPRGQAPTRDELRRLYGVIDDIAAVLPAATFAAAPMPGEARQFGRAAAALDPDNTAPAKRNSDLPPLTSPADAARTDAAMTGTDTEETGNTDTDMSDILTRARRITQLAAG